MAAVPRRAPDSGSASTGQPLAAANTSTAAGSRSAPHPATSSPLGLARTASASSATSPGAADRIPAGVAVHGAPPARPSTGSPASRASPSAAGGTSGSAKARLRWTGPAGGPVASAHARLASERQVAAGPRLVGGHAGLAEPPHRRAVQLELVGGLVGPGPAQLGRPVRGQHQQRDPGQVGLKHRRVEVGRRRPRGAQRHHRPPRPLGRPQGEERRRALVQVHMHPDPRMLRQGQRHRRRPRPRSQAGIGHPRPWPARRPASGRTAAQPRSLAHRSPAPLTLGSRMTDHPGPSGAPAPRRRGRARPGRSGAGTPGGGA